MKALRPLLLLVLTTGNAVLAADNGDEQHKHTQLEEIIVSGEKLGRSLADTVTAISVFDEAGIADQGDLELSELLRRAGNTTANEEGKISIRGISQAGAGGGTGSPLISVQVDGVTLDDVSQQGASTELFDIAQVEVLRGAQSSSQGRNSLAGAVVMRTREPTRDYEAKARLLVTEHNLINVAAAGGGPLSDSWAFRVTGITETDPGFVTHTPSNNEDFAKTDKSLLRLKLAFEPSYWKNFDSQLTLSTDDRQGQPDYNIERGTAGADRGQRRSATVNEETRDDTQSELIAWRNRYRFSESLLLTSITAYMKTYQDYIRDFDGTNDDAGVNYLLEDGGNLTQEFRLNFDNPGRYKGILGLYAGSFTRDNYTYSGEIVIPADYLLPAPGVGEAAYIEVDFASEDQQDVTNYALFTEVDIELPWHLTATLGMRYDYEKLDQKNRYSLLRGELFLGPQGNASNQPGINVAPALIAGGFAPDTDGFQGGETDYSALLPKAALRFAATDEWNLFVSYSEAYRAGGVDVNTQTGEAFPYDPEYTKNYEVGARGSYLESGLDMGVNLFYVEWEDQQVPVLRGIFFANENAASSSLHGLDVFANWQASDTLSLNASLGWVETEFEDYKDSQGDYSGNDFIMAPPITASFGGVYRAAPWMASANVSYRDHAYTRPSNMDDEFTEERTLVDVRVGWEGARLAAYLFAYNIFDEDYLTETYQFREGYIGASSPRGYAAYGRPREVGIQLEVNY